MYSTYCVSQLVPFHASSTRALRHYRSLGLFPGAVPSKGSQDGQALSEARGESTGRPPAAAFGICGAIDDVLVACEEFASVKSGISALQPGKYGCKCPYHTTLRGCVPSKGSVLVGLGRAVLGNLGRLHYVQTLVTNTSAKRNCSKMDPVLNAQGPERTWPAYLQCNPSRSTFKLQIFLVRVLWLVSGLVVDMNIRSLDIREAL